MLLTDQIDIKHMCLLRSIRNHVPTSLFDCFCGPNVLCVHLTKLMKHFFWGAEIMSDRIFLLKMDDTLCVFVFVCVGVGVRKRE